MTVQTFIDTHDLGELWSPILRTATVWIDSAAPAWATAEQRALACLDLGTCFFLLDDCPTEPRHDDLEHVASGGAPSNRLQRAFAALFEQLSTYGSLSHYLRLRVEFARALRARERIRSGEPTTVEDYLALREITIYFAPWLSTWQLLGGFELTSREQIAVAPAFAPANRWQVLENERVSLARDRTTHTPNVIALLAAQRGDSLANALADVAAWASADLDAYTAASLALASQPVSPSVKSYLSLLEVSVDGAIRHYKGADAARYH
jgi:hypothetical protein